MRESTTKLNPREVYWIVASIVFFTFVCYLTIGMPLAVLPRTVHVDLGFGTVLAGLTVSAQYFASPVSRASAGRMADVRGAKLTVMTGLAACAISALSLPLASYLASTPVASLVVLIVGRVVLGFGESWVGTGAIVWGIGRAGVMNTARVISLNGMTTYGAIALGAPCGVFIEGRFGLATLGMVMAGLALTGFILAIPRVPAPIAHGERMPIRGVLGRITPFGLALAAGTVGFGAISTFITLFYASQRWSNPAFALTAFGLGFVAVRLVFTHVIETFGGYRIAIICLTAETAGLLLLTLSPSPGAAIASVGLVGAGMSLLFPALGTELLALVPPASRGATLGVFNMFLDLCLGATGPLAGVLAHWAGYRSVYECATFAGLVGVAIAVALFARSRRVRLAA